MERRYRCFICTILAQWYRRMLQ